MSPLKEDSKSTRTDIERILKLLCLKKYRRCVVYAPSAALKDILERGEIDTECPITTHFTR